MKMLFLDKKNKQTNENDSNFIEKLILIKLSNVKYSEMSKKTSPGL